jgi:hypothetical protein
MEVSLSDLAIDAKIQNDELVIVITNSRWYNEYIDECSISREEMIAWLFPAQTKE